MHATLSIMIAETIRARNIPVKLIMIETGIAAHGKTVMSARLRTQHMQDVVIEGDSTDPDVSRQVTSRLDGNPRVLVAELRGNFMSSESYPHVYAEACRIGIVNNHTTAVPMMGATIWRPMDSSAFPMRKGTPIMWGNKLIYSSPVAQSGSPGRPGHALSALNGLMEFYKFENMDLQSAIDQTNQDVTSHVLITQDGELNSIVFSIWVRLGDADGRSNRTTDELVTDTPDLALKL